MLVRYVFLNISSNEKNNIFVTTPIQGKEGALVNMGESPCKIKTGWSFFLQPFISFYGTKYFSMGAITPFNFDTVSYKSK